MKLAPVILAAVLSISIMGCTQTPAPVSMPTPQSGLALQSCVILDRCDDDTNRMLNRVGSILKIAPTTIQRDLRGLSIGESPSSTILFDVGIAKADIDRARATTNGLLPYLDGQLRNFIAYCDKGGQIGCKNSGPLRPL